MHQLYFARGTDHPVAAVFKVIADCGETSFLAQVIADTREFFQVIGFPETGVPDLCLVPLRQVEGEKALSVPVRVHFTLQEPDRHGGWIQPSPGAGSFFRRDETYVMGLELLGMRFIIAVGKEEGYPGGGRVGQVPDRECAGRPDLVLRLTGAGRRLPAADQLIDLKCRPGIAGEGLFEFTVMFGHKLVHLGRDKYPLRNSAGFGHVSPVIILRADTRIALDHQSLDILTTLQGAGLENGGRACRLIPVVGEVSYYGLVRAIGLRLRGNTVTCYVDVAHP